LRLPCCATQAATQKALAMCPDLVEAGPSRLEFISLAAERLSICRFIGPIFGRAFPDDIWLSLGFVLCMGKTVGKFGTHVVLYH